MKSKTKRLLALLCAVVMIATTFFGNWYTKPVEVQAETEATTEATPVELYGFENVTLNGLAGATDNSVMTDKEYVNGESQYRLKNDTDFDKKLFTAWVKFTDPDTENNWKNRICIGGTAGNGWGLSVSLSNDGKSLLVWDADGTKVANPQIYKPIEGSDVKVDSFLGETFLLQMGYEYLDYDNDGNKNDVRILVYVNGNEGINTVVKDCNMTTLGNYVIVSILNDSKIQIKSADLPLKPVKLEGFKNITISDFKDSTGAQMPTGTYSHGVGHNLFGWDGATDFNKVIFSMKVTFGPVDKGYDNALHFGGPRDDWNVMNLYPTSEEYLYIDDPHAPALTTGSMDPIVMNAKDAGVSSFVDDEFCLELSFEYYDADSDGGTDLKLGVYIDGMLYGGQPFTIKDINPAHKGTWLRWYSESSANVITLNDFKATAKPIRLSGFDTLTVSNFKDASGTEMESKAYPYDATAPDATFTLKNTSDNFANKLLSMKVKFGYVSPGAENYDTRMVIGADGVYSGIFVYVNSDDQLCIDNKVTNAKDERITVSEAGVSSFLNTPFILQMSFADISDGLVVGVFINGALCKTFEWSGVATSQYNNQIHLRRNLEDSFITVNSIYEDEFPKDPGIQPDPTFTKLTFGHFGITNNTYPYKQGDLAVYGQANGKTNLDKTVISGDIFLEGGNFIVIWGGLGGWNGLRMGASADTMSLQWIDKNDKLAWSTENLTSDKAGVKFVGEKYNLKLSAEIIASDEDAVANDIKIGIWFNDVLYNQEYFVAKDIGTDAYFGNYFSVYCASEGDKVTFGSQMDLLEQPSENLQKVTFFNYGVEDGTYEGIGADLNVKGSYIRNTTVAGTVLCGDVQFHNAGAGAINIFLGAGENAWYGVRLTKYNSSENMELTYQLSDTEVRTPQIFESSKAGVDFTKDKFNLMWSMELVDSDGHGDLNDLKIGVWFNGFLYQNQYIYITDYALEVGNGFGTYCGPGTSITLNSIYELTELPDKSFDRITFSDFALVDGSGSLESQQIDITGTGDVVAKAKAKDFEVLDKVVFSGDFRFADDASYQVIYGGDAGWDGLRVFVDPSSIGVYWYQGNDDQLVVWTNAEYAKLTSITKNTFNLMISTELVDADGDGKTNDIKIGVWFNEILYYFGGEGYHIVKDWGDQLKNGFSVWGATAGTSLMIRNAEGYQKNPYYYDEIAEYRGDSKKAPDAPVGMVFAGWYEDDAYVTAIEPEVTSGKAWAKFVEEDVLSVKPQVKLDSNNKVPTTSTDLRFVTTVDNLDYRRVSFFIEKTGGKGEIDAANYDTEPRLVYEKLYYIGDNSKTMEYTPNVFSWQSRYFKAFTLTGIPSSEYTKVIKVTPYWITMDGTTVRGKVLETYVDEYGKNASQAVSIKNHGKDNMPITGYFGPYPCTNANDAMLLPDLITDEYFKMIADSGVNVIISSNMDYKTYPNQVKKALELAEKYGVGIYVKDTTIFDMTTEGEVQAQIANYSGYRSFAGMYLVDEPGTDSYLPATENGKATAYSEIAAILAKNNITYYANMYPIVDAESKWWEGILGSAGINETDKTAYGKYMDEFNAALNTNVLSYDYYPFDESRTNDDGSYNLSLYFWNMAAIRDKAQSVDKPFWAFVQAGSQWNDKTEYFTSTSYYPDEKQFNWNVNTALAFGAQGIQYFPLIQPEHFAYAGSKAEDNMWDFNRNGLIGAFGNKTQWYDYAQKANAHIGAMDSVLMNSYNEQVIALGNAQNTTSGLKDVVTSASYKELTNASGNALIGCFNYKGKTALYVVNYDYSNSGDVTLNFNGTCNITKIENAKEEATSASSITLNMTAGEGILLVIN